MSNDARRKAIGHTEHSLAVIPNFSLEVVQVMWVQHDHNLPELFDRHFTVVILRKWAEDCHRHVHVFRPDKGPTRQRLKVSTVLPCRARPRQMCLALRHQCGIPTLAPPFEFAKPWRGPTPSAELRMVRHE
jgi:hypothetical protein